MNTGAILAVSQSLGTIPVDIDWVKIFWSIDTISAAQCFNTIDGIPSIKTTQLLWYITNRVSGLWFFHLSGECVE